ncbi:MAG: DUF1667 domain-containing protein [Spirochaetaceae bacterium]|jgi:CxxC motif-containing protein|nr:DUF1667 domain-containing protein [Spirochaetaceae bacterium]
MMKELLCITCPNGCHLEAGFEGDELIVTGNQCKRGIDFARAELTNPTRTLCSTVKTVFPKTPVVSVRTAGEIPKGKIFDVMHAINGVTLSKSIGIGEVVVPNVCGLGVDIIATSNILKENQV